MYICMCWIWGLPGKVNSNKKSTIKHGIAVHCNSQFQFDTLVSGQRAAAHQHLVSRQKEEVRRKKLHLY